MRNRGAYHHLATTVIGLCSLLGWSAAVRAEQHVVVVLDDSGSMDDPMQTPAGRVRRMEVAKRSLIEVLQQLPQETDVGVLALNSQQQGSPWIVPLGSRDKRLWVENISRLRAKGGTPLGASMRTAADALIEQRNRNVYGTYRLLVVTDGEANDPELVEQYLPQILARGLELNVIGVDMAGTHSLASRAHSYRAADDDVALTQAITEVLAETSGDDAGAAEDFELIAALPDGFAEAALVALNSRRSEPLAESQADGIGLNIRYNSTSSASSVIETLVGGFICCVGSFFGLIVLVAVLFGARRGGRSRRRR